MKIDSDIDELTLIDELIHVSYSLFYVIHIRRKSKKKSYYNLLKSWCRFEIDRQSNIVIWSIIYPSNQ